MASKTVDHSLYPLPDASYTRRKATDTLVIHCADTKPNQNFTAKDIREWHVLERGWVDIGYHIVILRDGTVQAGRPLWSVGAHVEGHNSTSIGVCLMGGTSLKGTEENNFTPEQWASLIETVRRLIHVYPITVICGHRDFPKVTKYCPSFDVATWLRTNKKAFGDSAAQ